jgi:16S rRNA (uracil1498-N3)-methyltransferase
MHRFFVDESQIIDNKIYIKGNDVKHIKDVLRLRINDEIEVSCNGTTYTCKIEESSKENVVVGIVQSVIGKNESPIEIALFQGLSKGNKMELILQKGTEIGIKHFYAVATHRSVVKIKDLKKEQSKVERWQSIVEEASKQSKRDLIPKVHGIISFEEMVHILKDEANIIVPYEDEKVITIKEGLEHIKEGRINIIIGPEGGFEPFEIENLKAINSKVVTLGPRILRTETAGLVASTIVLYEAGNLGVI